jgi:murein DD-endopeptidase MepM/ murein hydrolase activator NlpD
MKPRKLPATVTSALPQFHLRAVAYLFLLLLALVALPSLNSLAPGSSVSSDINNNDLSRAEEPTGPRIELDQAVTATPTAPVSPPDTRLVLEVKSGDSVSKLFKQAGFGPREVDHILSSTSDKTILSDISPGHRLAFEITPQQSLKSLELVKSPMESFKFTLNEQGAFEFAPLIRTPEIRLVTKEAVITDSLYMAAQRSGIPARMTMELNSIFGGVVDFYLDTQPGDTFRIVFEEKFLDGKQVEYGNIVAAEFANQGEHFKAVRYVDSQGKANFFSPMGESMRKAFLLNPLDYTRISDGFNLSRKHPILNTIRAHRGTDYAAPTGTEVKATADGRVTFVGRKGSFGKLVVIQHGDRFETKYAHLNAYAKGIKVGARVSQQDVIGYVGSTGGATGPHLHYEFLMDGVHRNSRTIHDQLPLAESIASADLPAFRRQIEPYLKLLEEPNNTAAAASGTSHSAILEQ